VSRLGKMAIEVPHGVETIISPDMKVAVKGAKGRLELDTHGRVTVRRDGNRLIVDRHDDSKPSRAYHGLYQRLISNMVVGVSRGFRKELEIQGVGYRARIEGKGLTLSLGFSHLIHFEPPQGIALESPQPTEIVVSGCDKQLVGQVAANIRAFRKPEPYKGKGIRYKGEYVRRKVGKTGA